MQLTEMEEYELYDGSSTSNQIQNENTTIINKNSTSLSWPEPILCSLKEGCLKEFLHRMFMSKLAEATCTVCNVRTPKQKSKSVVVSKLRVLNYSKFQTKLKP